MAFSIGDLSRVEFIGPRVVSEEMVSGLLDSGSKLPRINRGYDVLKEEGCLNQSEFQDVDLLL